MNTYFKFVKIPEGMVKEDTFELIKEEKVFFRVASAAFLW